MAGRGQALHMDLVDKPDRPRWFAEGRGRCFVGYSDALYQMPVEGHRGIRARVLPLGRENGVNLLFVDLLVFHSLLVASGGGWCSSS